MRVNTRPKGPWRAPKDGFAHEPVRNADRLKVIEEMDQRKISQAKAARLLGVTERQVRRMLVRLREQGDRGLVHRGRGRSAHNRLAPKLRDHVLTLLQPLPREGEFIAI